MSVTSSGLYPIIEPPSSSGPMFTPIEKGTRMRIQLMKGGKALWHVVWVEINGHAFSVFNSQRDKEAAVVFLLQEIKMIPAVRGLPRKEIEDAPIIAVISRQHRDAVMDDSTFFFELSGESEQKAFLHAFHVNREWARRFSGKLAPGKCVDVEYDADKPRLRCKPTSTRYTRAHRFEIQKVTSGLVDKKGSRFDSKFNQRKAQVSGTNTLQFFTRDGNDLKGAAAMAETTIIIVCNDVAKYKGRESARSWFGFKEPTRSWILRVESVDVMDHWIDTLQSMSRRYANEQRVIATEVKKLEKAYKGAPVRYTQHKVDESEYPMLPRQPMPGRPTSPSPEEMKRNRAPSSLASSSRLGSSSMRLKRPAPRGVKKPPPSAVRTSRAPSPRSVAGVRKPPPSSLRNKPRPSASARAIPNFNPPSSSDLGSGGGASSAELERARKQIASLQAERDELLAMNEESVRKTTSLTRKMAEESEGRQKLFDYEKKLMDRVKDLEEQVFKLTEEGVEKTAEVGRWKEAHMRADRDLMHEKERVTELELENREVTARMESLNKEVEEIQRGMDRSLNANESASTKLKTKLTQEKGARELAEKENAALNSKVSTLEGRVRDLEEDTQNLRAAVDEADVLYSDLQRDSQDALGKMADERDALKSQLTQCKADVEQADREILRIEGELSGKSQENEALRQQLNLLQATTTEKQGSIQEQLSEARNLAAQREGQIGKMNTTISQLKEDNAKNMAEVARLQGEEARLQQELQDAGASKEKKALKHKQQLAELNKQVTAKDAQCLKMGKELDSLKQEAQRLEERLTATQATVASLEDELEEAQAMGDEAGGELTAIRERLREKEEEILELSTSNAKMTGQVELLTQQVSTLREEKTRAEDRLHALQATSTSQTAASSQQVATLTVQLEQRNSELERLREQHAAVQQSLAAAEGDAGELRPALEELQAAHAAQTLQMETLKSQAQLTQDELQEALTDAVEERSNLENKLSERIEELQQFLLASQEMVEQLEETSEIHTHQIEALELERDEVMAERDTLTQRIEELNAQLEATDSNAGEKIANLTETLARRQEELDTTIEEREALAAELAETQQSAEMTKETLQEELQELQDESREKEQTLRDQISSMEVELASFKARSAGLATSEEGLQAQVTELSQELAVSEAERDGVSQKLEAVEEQLEAVTGERDKAREEGKKLSATLLQTRKELQKFRAAAEKKLGLMKQKYGQLKEDAKQIKAKARTNEQELNKELRELQREVLAAKKSAAAGDSKVEKWQRDLQKAKDSLTAKKEELATLNSKFAALTSKFSAQGTERLELDKQIKALERKAENAEKEKERALSMLENTSMSSEQFKEELMAGQAEREKEMGELMAMNDDLMESVEKLKKSLTEMEEERDETVQKLEKQIGSLKTEAAKTSGSQEELQIKLSELQQERLDADAAAKAARGKVKALEDAVLEYRQKIAQLEPQLSAAEALASKNGGMLELVSTEKDKLEAKLEQLEAETKKESKDNMKEREKMTRELMQAQSQVKELEGAMADALSRVKASEAGAGEQVKLLKEQLLKAKAKADEGQALADATYAQLQEAKDQVGELEDELEKLHKKYKNAAAKSSSGGDTSELQQELNDAVEYIHQLKSMNASLKESIGEMREGFMEDYQDLERQLERAKASGGRGGGSGGPDLEDELQAVRDFAAAETTALRQALLAAEEDITVACTELAQSRRGFNILLTAVEKELAASEAGDSGDLQELLEAKEQEMLALEQELEDTKVKMEVMAQQLESSGQVAGTFDDDDDDDESSEEESIPRNSSAN